MSGTLLRLRVGLPVAAFPKSHGMLTYPFKNTAVIKEKLRAILLVSERSPKRKLFFRRVQYLFQLGSHLFLRLLYIKPGAFAQYGDQVSLDPLLRNGGKIVEAEPLRYGV